MPFYNKKGSIPPKRHTAFKRNDENYFYEELVSRKGFSGIFSNLYHINRPTKIIDVGAFKKIQLSKPEFTHKARHINTSSLDSKGDIVTSRVSLFYNQDIVISVSKVKNRMDYFYKNSAADELLYIQSGEGEIITNFGNLKIYSGDYVIIPRGVIWKMSPDKLVSILIIESSSSIETPIRYRNQFGQLLEHSPLTERDIRTPVLQEPISNIKSTLLKVKTKYGIQEYTYANSPVDVVGWDGYYYPWVFSIHDFEPIVGSIHQPPPVHQTFQADGFVICSFVPRLFDFHPNSIPAPYPHSNVNSDELIYYSKGDFMSRKGISKESMTLHPMGIPHGPQPGKYHSSIGKKKTEELAVMIDTFKPLNITDITKEIDDSKYPLSWSK